MVPVRGQTVLLTSPGLSDWLLNEAHPDGMILVLPRGDTVVGGGTNDVGATDLRWDASVERAILSRDGDAVPELHGAVTQQNSYGNDPRSSKG